MTDPRTTYDAAAELAHIPPLTSLEGKVTAPNAALLVIDMQNDFCAEGGMGNREGFDISAVQAMAARLPGFLDKARAASVPVIFVRNLYSTEANRYLSDSWLEQAARMRKGSYTLTPVCGEDDWGGEFYGNIRPQQDDHIVTKHRFNAFQDTDLDLILRTRGIRSLIFTGCLTNVCVETTARDAFMRDYYVVVTSNGTAAYADADHDMTLSNISRFFGEVAQLGDIERVWAQKHPQ